MYARTTTTTKSTHALAHKPVTPPSFNVIFVVAVVPFFFVYSSLFSLDLIRSHSHTHFGKSWCYCMCACACVFLSLFWHCVLQMHHGMAQMKCHYQIECIWRHQCLCVCAHTIMHLFMALCRHAHCAHTQC